MILINSFMFIKWQLNAMLCERYGLQIEII